MADKVYAEHHLAIRIDSRAVGKKCCHCHDVEAEHQPEMFLQTKRGWRFVCKLCAWDHAPWLVSIINMGHYNEWEAWGGVPPSPEALVEKSLTIKDMLGDEVEVELDEAGEVAHPHRLINVEEEERTFESMLVDGVLEGPQKASLVENRRSKRRYRAAVPASLKAVTDDNQLHVISATTRDFGDDGIFLDTDQCLPLGTSVKLQMAFPGGDDLKVVGTVARCAVDGMAIQFKHTSWENVQNSIQHLEQAVGGLARAFSKKS